MKFFTSTILFVFAFASCKKDSTPEIDQRVVVKYDLLATAKFTNPSWVYITESPGKELPTNMLITDSVWSAEFKFPKGAIIKFETGIALAGINQSFVSSIYFNGVKKATLVPSVTTNVNNTTRGATKLEMVVE
ncbi:hypothetical protein [Sediminibacterium sp.]|uniref:hypothetical protein n=1 Tax=Sediminibacterium sp. TaxID=1917865 RepID=UPI0027326C0F|nr:hypothetical protein [Sediminibacterium sp.]MDP3395016.1 hypothetical protein [Sediminibacterium sp.]MDP3565643.1 hypothetical protein [Sediminibacterium sp.]